MNFMPLPHENKKPSEISPLRPRYAEKTPPCTLHCPIGTDIRGFITTIAQAEDFQRTGEAALTLAWRKITEVNPFPAVCGRVCPYPLLLTKKALEKLASGQVLKVLCDAPASAEDSIPRYAEKQGYGFEAVKIEDKGMWELFIKKS